MKPVIALSHVAKKYRRYGRGLPTARTLKTWLLKEVLGKKTGDHVPQDAVFWALKDISFTVEQGQTVGVIGRNGAGKSTLLKVLSKILKPDQGTVHIEGRVVGLIELGAGFHPELTGRENILVNGVILGLSKLQIKERIHEIIAFADIGSFIDEPVYTYSSGMYARLGFAVAAHVDPEILLVDEVLSVGDAVFARKCHAKLDALKAKGTSILLVSHDLHTVRTWCDKAVWIDQGNVVQQGPAEEVVRAYELAMEAV